MEFIYRSIDPDLLNRLAQFKKLMELFKDLMLRLRGDVNRSLEVLDSLQEQGYLEESDLLADFKSELLKKGIIEPEQPTSRPNQHSNPRKKYLLSDKGRLKIREAAFKELFSHLKLGDRGNHSLHKSGKEGFEISSDKRPFEFGDEFNQIDFHGSLINSVKRVGNLNLEMAEDDLEIYEREQSTDAATVLMIDISHSMILYGEDRITPAKELALALVHLIKTRFPRDDLRVVLFGDDAVEVKVDQLTEIDVGPYHTNTQMGLRKAREILGSMKQTNKQILMITDGKPSMIKLTDGRYYKNSFGLDPEIVTRTLDEAILCRKKGIGLLTFMITQDPTLQDFVSKLTKVAKGKAFYSSVNQVGKFVIENFLKNKRYRS